MYWHMHMRVGAHTGQKRLSEPLVLELRAAVTAWSSTGS